MALMFDIRMLKTLFHGLAAANGVVPFQTPAPRLASGVVAPYADRYVDSVRNEVIDAHVWRQGNAAMWVGTVRTAMIAPAGLVDFFGPMGEETLEESAVRMSQEIVSGVFSLSTHFANIIVGPISEAPPFDQTLAQTEWALGAASYIYGAKSMVKRIVHSRAAIQPLFLEISEQDLVAVLEKHGGHRGKVAEELGVRTDQVSGRIYGAPKESPLDKFKTLTGRRGPKKRIKSTSKVPDDELAVMLERHHGNRSLVVKNLAESKRKLSISTISNRIKSAADGSPLAKYKKLKGKRGRRRKVSDHKVLASLQRYRGDRSKAAAELRMSPSTVYYRIRVSASDSPLAAYKGVRGEPGTQVQPPESTAKEVVRQTPTAIPLSHLDDAAIARALVDNRRDTFKVALQLKCSTDAIARRIAMAAEDSPLAAFKNKRR